MTTTPETAFLESDLRRIRVGLWGYYEELMTDNFILQNGEAAIGANLLQPWVDLNDYARQHGIDFVTLDLVNDPRELDAIILSDRPRPGNPLLDRAMQVDIRKYLMLSECDVIKPDNWDTEYHKQFDRIFTWNDDYVDGRRYIKNNMVMDAKSRLDFSDQKSKFSRRKLATLIAGAKMAGHPKELYSERIRIIRWFEENAAADFDLYGIGWNPNAFPSYRGKVADKLATLSEYRFLLCLENARFISGYITEKIWDAFRAGVVPIYGGAPNIERWVPADCFIDLRQFTTYGDLHAFIAAMDESSYTAYLERIEAFLDSRKFYPFSTECFIKTVTGIIDHDVRTARGERPVLPPQDPRPDVDSGTRYLVQDTMTLELRLLEAIKEDPGAAAIAAAEKRYDSFKQGRNDLVVIIGYGDELPVYLRARALWDFYASHFPNVRIIFRRDTESLAVGEVYHNGHDLLIGVGQGKKNAAHAADSYAATGNWSVNENKRMISVQMAIYDYLLRSCEKPFFQLQVTITSILDFRGLLTVLDRLPRQRCYAGFPIRLTGPQEYAGMTFISGANTLVSSDVVALMRNRYDPEHLSTSLPNDVWQALALPDIPRIPLPFFSFTTPRQAGKTHDDVRNLTTQLLRDGYYHFRIKTSNTAQGAREDIDPWLMIRVMEAILASNGHAAANLALADALAVATKAVNGSIPPRTDESFFTGSRRFPFNEEEARLVYPDLFQ